MATKKATKRVLKVGDRVIRVGSDSAYEVTRVNDDGTQADLCLEGTDLERFRVPVETLTFPKK